MLLSIYYYNQNCFDLNFCFKSSGLAIIRKNSDTKLTEIKKLKLRSNSIKNFVRKIWQKLKKN